MFKEYMNSGRYDLLDWYREGRAQIIMTRGWGNILFSEAQRDSLFTRFLKR